MSRAEQPTFHEIRALGSWLYEQAGYERDYAQALMAHSDEKMTAQYQLGHEQKWVDVRADLDLAAVIKRQRSGTVYGCGFTAVLPQGINEPRSYSEQQK